MSRPGRHHPGDPCRRHRDHLDRACRAGAGRGRRSAGGDQFRPPARRGRAAPGDGRPGGAGRLSRDPGVSLLETRELTAYYGDFQALFGITLAVEEGETLAIIGANGAGKSTFLRSLVGSLAAPRESIRFDGRAIGGRKANEVVRLGLGLVPEGRRLFASLTVEENLRIGAYGGRRRPRTLEGFFRPFPALPPKRAGVGTAPSAGHPRMAAIGRALLGN